MIFEWFFIIFECLVICAALGALSDRISLKKPMNRAVIKLGIDYLNTTKLAGMKALKEISIPKRSSLTLRAREISRTIAPRMNAPGRIGNPALNIPDSSIVVDLLIAGLSIGPRSDIKKFIEKYKKLLHQDKLIKSNLDINDQVEIVDEVNSQRKRMTEEIETKIEELLQSINLSEEKVVIVKGQNWNSGVIGIDADRLKDRLMKPAIVMTSLEGSEYLKGSVRSLKSINMYEIMEKTQIAFEQKIGHNPYQVKVNTQLGERFVNAFGGHAQACGFTIHKNDIDQWEELLKIEVNKIPPENFDFNVETIKQLSFYQVNHKLLSELDTLAPYGEGFDYPIFKLCNIKIDTPKAFGNQFQSELTPHIEFKVKHEQNKKQAKDHFLKATGYSLNNLFHKVVTKKNDFYDIVFTIDYPFKRTGKKTYPQLLVIDIKKSSEK